MILRNLRGVAASAVLLFSSMLAAAAPAGTSVVRVETRDRAVIQQLAAVHGHLIVSREKGIVVFEADADEIARLRTQGLVVSIDDDATTRLRESEQLVNMQRAGIPGYACYRTVAEAKTRLDALVTQYPQLASVVDIGDSWEKTASLGGEDLRVIKLTNTALPGPKPVMFMMSAIHAREYTTAEVTLRFVEWLLANHGVDADATWILDHQEVHLLVHTNPDGRKQAETGLLWRKNTRTGACNQANSRGTDLNRNYPFKWNGAQDGNGSSGLPCEDTYRGPLPQSEPETTAVVSYIRTIFPDQRGDAITDAAPATTQGVFLDIHSYSQLVLWPWGWTNTGAAGIAPNAAQLETLGRRFAWFNGYEPEQANELYSTDGTTDDNAYGDLGVAAYTFELGTAFFESCASFESSTNPLNFAALLYGARTTRAPYRWPGGPETRAVTITPDLVVAGEPATLTATIDDSRFNQQNGGAQVAQAIASAKAYVATPPWAAGNVPIALAASDGAFNASSETVTGSIATAGLASGRHLVYVQGRDASTADGVPSAAFLEVATANEIATVHGVVRDQSNNTPIGGATVTIGTRATPSAAGTGAYSRRVTAGTYTITATAPDFQPYTATGVALAGGSDVTRDIALAPLCTVLTENAENGTNGWTTAGTATWGIIQPNAVTTSRAWTESPSGNYTNNLDASIVSPVMNLAAYTSPVLSFDSYCDTESGYDYGIVEVSASPGTWTEVYRCDAQPQWRRIVVPVPTLAGSTQARVRFRFDSDQSQIDDGWYVDNIAVKASGSCGNIVVAAPGAPALRAASDTGLSQTDGVTQATTLTFDGACVNGDAIQLRANGTSVGTAATCSGGAYALSFAPAEGTYAITTRASRGGVDSVDSGSISVTVDRTAPAAPGIVMPAASYPPMTPIGGTMVENAGVVIASEGATTLCTTAVLGPSSNQTWACTATLAPGPHGVSATQRDVAGNTSAPSGAVTINVSGDLFANGFE